jgi:hypothetical protein
MLHNINLNTGQNNLFVILYQEREFIHFYTVNQKYSAELRRLLALMFQFFQNQNGLFNPLHLLKPECPTFTMETQRLLF